MAEGSDTTTSTKAAEKEAKRLRLRGASMKELVETEIQYVKDLQILTDVYIEPLKTNNIINAEQHRLLFNNIPALIKLNSQFSLGLSHRYNNGWDPATSKIALEFLQFAPYFHMYQGYLNSHEQAAGLVSKLYIRSTKFKKFVDQAQFNPQCKGLDLKSYLVKPLQRITKYTLLLRELIKHTLKDHPDYNDLSQAMAKINEVNITINDKMKTFDQRQKVRDIQARFTQNVDLVAPARIFIKEGKLSKICRKKDVEYIFILFSDLLIYGERASGSEKNGATKNKNFQIKIHQQIPINQSFRIRDIPQNMKYGAKCFEIHSPEKSFIVYADHPGAKYEWYSEMEKVVALRSTIESGKQRPAALWVPDDFTDHCMMNKCVHKFNVINRRHHCRYCGRLVCGPCSTQKLPHWTKTNKTVRVCIMCYNENKELINYAAKMKERKGTEDAQQADKLIKGILDDEDSMSVGSEIDFEFWDSESINDDDNEEEEEEEDDDDEMNMNGGDIKSNDNEGGDEMKMNGDDMSKNSITHTRAHTHTKTVSEDVINIILIGNNEQSVTVSDDTKEQSQVSQVSQVSQTLTPTGSTTLNTKQFQRKSAKMKRKSKNKLTKQQMKNLHHRSASLGCEQDLEPRHSSNRGIFSNSAKIFRLSYSHTPKKSTRTFHELQLASNANGSLTDKRDSGSISLDSKAHSLISPSSNILSGDDEKENKENKENKDNNNSKYDEYTNTKNRSHVNGLSVGLPAPLMLSALSSNNNSNASIISNSPRHSGSSNRRLKIVGTGTLNIEAHQYDHELVSMRLHTFTEVIDWNLDPHSMKPKKKDDFSCYLKALNVLSQQNEILLIRIKNKDIMDSLVTILLSLSYYYEAENANRDDDDMDSDIEEDDMNYIQIDMNNDTQNGNGGNGGNGGNVKTVSLSKDTTLQDHKAEIDRAVFLIENSKKHNNIKTLDVAKFLLAKSCPISVIQHAFGKACVIMPDEVYELAGVPHPKNSKMAKLKLKEKALMKKQLNKTGAGKGAVKASKLLGMGFHRESIATRKSRSNSGDFGDRSKYKKKYSKIELKQSHSAEAKDNVSEDDDWWLPNGIKLPDADNDNRYQDALCQHDIRFHVNKYNNQELATQTLPSDKLDSQLRIVMNAMSHYSKKGGNPQSPFDNQNNISLNYLSTTKIQKDKTKRKSKKFSIFGKKKDTDI